MPSEAFSRFVSSLELDYDRWHDGEGYDLEALGNIEQCERGDAAHLLAQRKPTWREIEALAAIDIPPAFMAIERALRDSRSIDTRLAAARHSTTLESWASRSIRCSLARFGTSLATTVARAPS